MSSQEILRVEAYLKEKLNPGVRLVARDKSAESYEMYLGAEFLALLFRIDEEGEVSYQLQMTVLQEDLMGDL